MGKKESNPHPPEGIMRPLPPPPPPKRIVCEDLTLGELKNILLFWRNK